MCALSNSFLRSILLFSFNQDLLLFGKFSVFKMFILNKTRKNVKEWEWIPPISFWMTKQHSLISLPLLSRTVHSKSHFLSQQPNEQWMLSFFKWQRVFLVIPLLSSGPTFPTSFLLLSFHFHDLYPLCVKNIPPIIILPFQFIRFFSFPSFLRLFQI